MAILLTILGLSILLLGPSVVWLAVYGIIYGSLFVLAFVVLRAIALGVLWAVLLPSELVLMLYTGSSWTAVWHQAAHSSGAWIGAGCFWFVAVWALGTNLVWLAQSQAAEAAPAIVTRVDEAGCASTLSARKVAPPIRRSSPDMRDEIAEFRNQAIQHRAEGCHLAAPGDYPLLVVVRGNETWPGMVVGIDGIAKPIIEAGRNLTRGIGLGLIGADVVQSLRSRRN